MTSGTRILCVLLGACLCLHYPATAEAVLHESGERIGAHFEALSSRLLVEDAAPLTQFVAKAGTIPGAKLAILVPVTHDASRARFVAARVAELERHVRSLADSAELRKVQGNVGGDVLWLAIIPPPPAGPQEKEAPVVLQPPAVKSESLTQLADRHPPVTLDPADLRLTDWVVRGVKHPARGPTYAYVAKAGSSEAPREVVEQQTDKELGLVKAISQSPDGAWIVHTEIGWIGQIPSAGSIEAEGN